MLANKDVNSIKLNTRLGKCNLDIEAHLRNDDKAMTMLGQYALAFLVWHVIPASAYDKKSAFKRNSDYSDALSTHMIDETKKILGDCFEKISVKTSKYEGVDKEAKAVKVWVELGMSEADAKALVKAEMAKLQQKSEATTEVEV